MVYGPPEAIETERGVSATMTQSVGVVRGLREVLCLSGHECSVSANMIECIVLTQKLQ